MIGKRTRGTGKAVLRKGLRNRVGMERGQRGQAIKRKERRGLGSGIEGDTPPCPPPPRFSAAGVAAVWALLKGNGGSGQRGEEPQNRTIKRKK